jgi:hypothetical protein
MTDADSTQRAVLGALSDAHPRMLPIGELEAVLGRPDTEQAVRRLSDDGLANVLGERVGLSRPAVRLGQLVPLQVDDDV